MKVLKYFFILAVSLFSCTDSIEIETENKYERAMNFYQSEQYEEALADLKIVFASIEGERNELMVKSLYLRGFIFYLQDKNKLAYQDYLEAIDIAVDIGDDLRVSRLYNEIGQIFYERELYDQALTHFQLAYEMSNQATLQDKAYYSYGVGKTLKKLNRLEEGMEYILDAVAINSDLRNYNALADDYIEMGVIQWMVGNYKQSIEHNQKIIEIASLTNKPNFYNWIANNNIGNVYLETRQFEKAESFLLEAIKYKNIRNQLWVTYNNLGRVYNETDRYENAWECFKKSLVYNKNRREVNELAITNRGIKKTLQELNQPDSLLHYSIMINDMALPAIETKEWLKGEEEKIALLTKYQDYMQEKAKKDQYARTSWMTAFIMAFIFVSGVLSMRLWKIYNYKSPKKAHGLIKNSGEMVYLLDMFKKEKEEMKKVMDQKFGS